MAKRAFASLLAIALCIAPLSHASGVTAKAGASCAKLKATSIVKGKKFTCVKSGKKLVWNKGVLVRTLVTKPKPANTTVKIVCPKVDTADQSGISQVRADALIGMSESEGYECAASLTWGFRVGQRDKEMYATTRDYRFDRVTVVVMLGVITRVDVG